MHSHISLLVALSLLFIGARGAPSTSTDSTTVLSWSNQVSSRFDTVTSQVLQAPKIAQVFSDATRTEVPEDGQQKVAVLATRLAQIFQGKLQALQSARTQLATSWNSATSSVADCASILETTFPPPTGYGRNISLASPPCKHISPEAVVSSGRLVEEAGYASALFSVWNQTAAAYPTVLYQYFASSNGAFQVYPANTISDFYDARFSDWYTSALGPRRRAIVILDNAGSVAPTAALLTGLQALLSSFSFNDRIGLLLTDGSLDPSQGLNCNNSTDPLVRGTAEEINHLLTVIDSLNSNASNAGSSARGLPAALERAATLLTSQNRSNDGSTHIIYIFTSGKVTEASWRVVQRRKSDSLSTARIFTFSSGKNADRVWLRRLACMTDGAYYEATTDTASVRALVADSFRLLAPSSQVSAAWTPTLGFKSDLNNGLVISASLAVISPSTGEFLGVVGLDFRVTELQSIVSSTVQKLSYSFLLSSYGDALIHPKLDTGRGSYSTDTLSSPPLYRDILTYETTTADVSGTQSFTTSVRNKLYVQKQGTASFTIARSLPQGDAAFNYVKSRLVPVHYYWTSLEQLPFVLVLSLAEEDIVQIDYDPRSTEIVWYQFAQQIADNYPSYAPAGGWQSYIGADGYSTLTDLAATFQVGPDYWYNVDPVPLLDEPDLCLDLHRYWNDLGAAPSNPGVNRRAKSYSRVLQPVYDDWRNAAQAYTNTLQLNFLYFGSPDSFFVQFPGYLDGALWWYNPARRPWYLLAVSNPNLNCLTAPYLDSGTLITITTIAKTIYDDKNRLMGVVGLDLTYPELHRFVFSSTGCRLSQNDTTSPKCYLFDESALLTTSFNFYDPLPSSSGQYTPIDNRFLGIDEPELAQDLLSKGIIKPVTVNDFSQAPAVQNQVFQVNGDAILSQSSGIVSGSLSSSCQQGSYFLTKVNGTNMYLAVIHSYEILSTSNCPTIAVASSEPLPADLCKSNDASEADETVYVSASTALLETRRLSVAKCSEIAHNIIRNTDTYAGSIVMMALACLGIIACIVLAVSVYLKRRTPVVRATNLLFCNANLIGCAFLFGSIFALAQSPDKRSCVVFAILAGVGFATVVSVSAAKMIRIRRIITNTSLLTVPIDSVSLAMYASIGVGVECLFLIIWMAGWTLESRLSRRSAHSTTYVEICGCDHLIVFTGIQIAIFGVLVLLGCVSAFLTRAVHRKILFSEARWVAWSLYLAAFDGTLFVLVRFFGKSNPHTQFILSALCIWVGAAGTLVLLYWTMVYVILLNPKLNESTSVGTGQGSTEINTEFKPDDLAD